METTLSTMYNVSITPYSLTIMNLSENSSVVTSAGLTASCSVFTFTIYVVLFGVVCVFGLIGNTVSFVVLSWERHSFVATFLLRVMACVDNLFLITTAFSQVPQTVFDYVWDDQAHWFTAYLTIFVWPLVHIAQMATVWITVLVAFNRYVAICWPFRAAVLCTMKQARLQVVSLFILIVLYNIPRFFEHRLDYDHSLNSTVANPTELKQNNVYNVAYENVLYFLFVFFGPLTLLAVLNSCLIHEMCKSRKRLHARQLPTSLHSEDAEHNLTVVMIIIVLVFVACQTPACINQILYVIMEEEYVCDRPYFFYYHVSNLVVCANSAVNFIVYCAFRKQFRQRLWAICTNSRYEYNSSLGYAHTDSLPLRCHSSRSTSLQIGGCSHSGRQSRSTSMQIAGNNILLH